MLAFEPLETLPSPPLERYQPEVRHTTEELQPIDLYLEKGKFPVLFGRPWLHHVELDW